MSTAPVITEERKPLDLTTGIAPQATAEETDVALRKSIAEKAERKGKRGGIHERIDQLTKQVKEAKEAAAERIRITEVPETKPVAAAVAVDDKPEPRPKAEDFADKDPAEYTTALAAWVVRQQAKITATPSPAAQPSKPADAANVPYDPGNPVHVQLKTELDGFVSAGAEFIKRNPDFNNLLADADRRGLKLDMQAQRAIVRLQAPAVAYYLAQPQNEQVARRLMALDSMSQVIEIGKLAERLQVKPSDFVSSAGNPGMRLTGGGSRTTIPDSELDTDSYLQKRRNDIRAGLRRGR